MQIPGPALDLPYQQPCGWGSVVPQMILSRLRPENDWLGCTRNMGFLNKEEGTTWASGQCQWAPEPCGGDCGHRRATTVPCGEAMRSGELG